MRRGALSSGAAALSKAGCLTASVGLLATLAIIIYALTPIGLEASDIIPLGPLILWNLSPYLALAAISWWLVRTRGQGLMAVSTGILATLFGLYLLTDALIIDRHVLNYLLLIGLPNILWGIVLVGAIVILILKLVNRTKAVDRDR